MKIQIEISNKKIFIISTILGISIFTILLIEVILSVCAGLNVLPYDSTSKNYNKFRGKKGAFVYGHQLNENGFNDEHVEVFDKPNEKKRILAIGDSYAYGVVPYENNYLTLLENNFKDNKKGVEVVNMGIPCMNLKDYYELLLDEGVKYRPDTILICFFSGNDYGIPIDYKNEKGESTYLIEINRNQKITSRVRTTSYFKANKIALKRLEKGHVSIEEEIIKLSEVKEDNSRLELINFLNYLINLESLEVDLDTYIDSSASFTIESFLKIEQSKAMKFRFYDKSIHNKMEFVIDYFQKIKSVGDSIGSKVIFVIQPEELQVSEELQNTIKNLDYYKNDTFDFYRTNRMLTQKMDSLNLTYIDLLEPFVESGKTTNLYKPRDTHWNIEGNKLAGEILYNQLKND